MCVGGAGGEGGGDEVCFAFDRVVDGVAQQMPTAMLEVRACTETTHVGR